MRTGRILNISLLAALMLCMSACGKKQTLPTIDFASTWQGAMPIDSLQSTPPAWHDLQVPVSIGLADENGKVQTLSGRMAMARDSVLQISLKAMGVEAVNAYILPDTVVVIDKYHKEYLAEGFASVFGAAGLTLGDVQDALLRHPFIPEAQAQQWRAQTLEAELSALAYWGEKAKAAIVYSDTKDGKQNIDLLLIMADKQAQMRITLDANAIKLDTGRVPAYRPPKGCQRIYGADIMRSIYSQ